MNARLLFLAVALSAAPMAASAQATAPESRGAGSPRREQMAERRDAMKQRQEARKAMTPEEREAARAAAQERFNSLSPERQQFIRDQRAYSQGLREKARDLRSQVQAGTLTKDAMAEQLKAYRDANRPARPEGTRKAKP